MCPNVRVFEDSETLKVGLEKTRRQILDLLKVKNMAISQISEALDKDQSTIYRHVKKLEEAGFIEVKGEKKEHHIPERIYGRTAEVFLMTPEPIDSDVSSIVGIQWNRNNVEECLNFLEKMGYSIEEEEMLDDLCGYLQSLDREINDELTSAMDDEKEIDYFSLLQIKFLASIIKIEKNKGEKEKIQEIISELEPPE